MSMQTKTQLNKNDSKNSMIFLASSLCHIGKTITMHFLCKCACPTNNCTLSSGMLHISGDEYSTNRLCSYWNSDSYQNNKEKTYYKKNLGLKWSLITLILTC